MTAYAPEHYRLADTTILAGEYPGHREADIAALRLDALLDAGVSLLVDLTETRDGLVDYEELLRARPLGREAIRVRAPIRDMGTTDDARLAAIVDLVHRAAESGTTTYLHCWGGIGRTGMVGACVLVRRGMPVDEALAVVAAGFAAMPKAAQPWYAGWTSPQTPAQFEAVRRYAGVRDAVAAAKR